jgi:NADPH2 dehydrogenase
MLMNTSLTINSEITLKNRVVVPAMASQTADNMGFVTASTMAHYSRLAQSKAGLVMVEYTYVCTSGKSESHQLGIHSDCHIEGLKKLSESIKSFGSISGIQLTHSGAKSERSLTGGPLLSPSGLPVPIKEGELEVPDVATFADIEALKKVFVNAARRATTAGFDIIELHSAHGYGLNQWLSSITNKRKDSYGGSLENRSRLLLEIILGIKEEVPNAILSVRIPGMDHFIGGLNSEDTKTVAIKLQNLGVSIVNVSSGIGGWRRPEKRLGEGYLVEDSAIIASCVKIPVIGVGGIKTATYINQALADKKFSLAAVGRSILHDPSWGERVGLI